MNAIHRTAFGHWSDSSRLNSDARSGPNARFLDLIDGDQRVSLAEQQDYTPESGKPLPVWLAIAFVAIFPLLTALIIHLVRLSLQN